MASSKNQHKKRLNVKIKRLANLYGVVLENRSESDSYSYNGHSIALLDWRGNLRSKDNLIHDIAHWVVAAPSRRKCNEFGLGDSPDIGTRSSSMLVKYKYAMLEESYASMLGIYWQWVYGIGDWLEVLIDHSWLSFSETSYVLDELSKDELERPASQLFFDYFSGEMPKDDEIYSIIRRLHKKGHLEVDESVQL